MSERAAEWLDGNEYPTDAAIERIRAWPFQDFRGLMDFVHSIWWPDGEWGWDEEQDGDVRKYAIATGGWSGNEDVIEALCSNFLFWSMCWESSHRGGGYRFEVKPTREASAYLPKSADRR